MNISRYMNCTTREKSFHFQFADGSVITNDDIPAPNYTAQSAAGGKDIIITYYTIHVMLINYHTMHIMSYHTIPYHTKPNHTISYPIIPYHIIPYHTTKYNTLTYATLHFPGCSPRL